MKKALLHIIAIIAMLLIVSTGTVLTYRAIDKDDCSWAYALDDVLCIGDSLTEGSYFGNEAQGEAILQSYPYYLSRMLNTDVTNAGFAGISASQWFENKIADYDYSDYNAVIIWLGTNNGLTDTLDTDVLQYSDYTEYAETETGYYCKIIEEIRRQNPDCLIVLMNVYASKGDVPLTNKVIGKIAALYDLHVIDTSSLGIKDNYEIHSGRENPHLGKAGNIKTAQLIVNDLNKYFAKHPIRCDFGIDYATKTEEAK